MKPAILAITTALALLHPVGAEQANDVQTQMDSGHALRKQGLPAAAREIYTHIASDKAASPFQRSEAQSWLGHALRDEGKLDQAIEAYSKVLFIPGAHPRHLGEAHVWIGQLHFVRGDYEKAKREFTATLNLPDPGPDHIRYAKERLAQISQLDERASNSASKWGVEPDERKLKEFLATLETLNTNHALKDLIAATTYAIGTFGPDARVMPGFLERLAKLAAQNSTEDLKAWFNLVPSCLEWGPLKSSLALRVYELLPKNDYKANARWAGEQTGSLHNIRVISKFAFDYAQADPEAAMNWVNTTKPKPDINIVIGVIEIVQAWSEKDLAGLEHWLDAHRDTPVFNQATRDIAVLYADSNRELAKKWGEQNKDPKRRAFIDKLLSKPPKAKN